MVQERNAGGAGVQAAAALDAVLRRVLLQLLKVVRLCQFHQEERLQAHRAGVGALAAADTVRFRGAPGLLFREEEQGAGSLKRGCVQIGNGLAHHRAAANKLGGIGRDTSQMVDDIAERSAHPYLQVGLVGEAVARNRHNIVDERLVLLHGVVYGHSRTDVLHHSANADRQRSGAHLTVHHRVDELLFAALRVTHLHRHYLYILIR